MLEYSKLPCRHPVLQCMQHAAPLDDDSSKTRQLLGCPPDLYMIRQACDLAHAFWAIFHMRSNVHTNIAGLPSVVQLWQMGAGIGANTALCDMGYMKGSMRWLLCLRAELSPACTNAIHIIKEYTYEARLVWRHSITTQNRRPYL